MGPTYHRFMEPVAPEDFDRLVAEALDLLPPELASFMDNVAVLTADRGHEPDLLGLYDGVPLTERGDYGGASDWTMPDRIHLYRLPLCEMCSDLDELRQEVVTAADIDDPCRLPPTRRRGFQRRPLLAHGGPGITVPEDPQHRGREVAAGV